MMSPDEQKRIFHEGWSHPSVVEHRVERFIQGEMGFTPSRDAWLAALRQVVMMGDIHQALDMGTGPGTIAQLWAEIGLETTGVDFSAPMLAAGANEAGKRGLSIHFIEADVEEPPFEDQTFDLVSSRAVLFTLPHPGYAVARWLRLLRPGGRMVLIGQNAPTDPEKLKRQYCPPKDWRPDEQYRTAMSQLPFHTHTDGMVRVLMEAAGLRDIQSIPTQAVIDARIEHETLNPHYGVLQGTPYILVGRR